MLPIRHPRGSGKLLPPTLLERNAPAAELAPLLRDELRQAVREAGAGGRSHAALLHWAGFAYAGA